jgi:hypothetical protein
VQGSCRSRQMNADLLQHAKQLHAELESMRTERQRREAALDAGHRFHFGLGWIFITMLIVAVGCVTIPWIVAGHVPVFAASVSLIFAGYVFLGLSSC